MVKKDKEKPNKEDIGNQQKIDGRCCVSEQNQFDSQTKFIANSITCARAANNMFVLRPVMLNRE